MKAAFRRRYSLDFLQLPPGFSEKDLENAIVKNIAAFIEVLGGGLDYLGRQKVITLNGKDFFLDLRFFHRQLNALLVVELKIDEFESTDRGVNRSLLAPGQNSPWGLILCAAPLPPWLNLLQLQKARIHVATYTTRAPFSEPGSTQPGDNSPAQSHPANPPQRGAFHLMKQKASETCATTTSKILTPPSPSSP